MFLFSTEMLSVQLVILPIYLLFFISYFLLTFSRRYVNLQTTLNIKNNHLQVNNMFSVITYCYPLFLIFLLLISSIRGFEGYFFLTQLYFSMFTIKFFFFIFFFFISSFLLFQHFCLKTTFFYIFELVISLQWLLWAFFWSLMITNLITYLFFLEIFSILLLLSIIYMYLINNKTLNINRQNIKTFNMVYLSKFSLIQTLLFFLWSSAVSMLSLFWSSLFLYNWGMTLNFSFFELLFLFNNFFIGLNWETFILFIFFFSLLLKISLLPTQFWLFTFYSNLPLLSLYVYILFYYIFFVIILFNLIFGWLHIFISFWFFFSLILLFLGILHFLFYSVETIKIKHFIAYSSIINLNFLFIFLIN